MFALLLLYVFVYPALLVMGINAGALDSPAPATERFVLASLEPLDFFAETFPFYEVFLEWLFDKMNF